MNGEWLLRCLARVTPTERGAYPLARRLRIAPGRRAFTLPAGVTLTLDPAVYPDILMAFGLYEKSVLRVIHRELSPGDVVIDGGANIGYVTLHAAKWGAHVHAFEPHTGNRARLSEHLRTNELADRVTVYPNASADRAQTLSLSDGGENHGEASLFGEGGQPVEAVALDELLPDLTPRLIKLDIEGAELIALKGMLGIIRRARPLIIGEFNPSQSRAAGVDPWAWVGLITGLGLGYRAYHIGAWLRRVTSSTGLPQCNLLLRA